MKTGTCKKCHGKTKQGVVSDRVETINCTACDYWEVNIINPIFIKNPYSSEIDTERKVNFLL